MKLIILDRDGVINRDSDQYIKSVDEWIALPGSIEAMARLYHAGFTLAVATNQSGIARGYYSEAVLELMHQKMQQQLAALGARVDLIVFCPHGPSEACDCRKPKPGLFVQIAAHYGLKNLHQVPVVGDSLRDLEAGMQLGCTPYLVKTGKGMQSLAKTLPQGTRVFDDLAALVDALLKECL